MYKKENLDLVYEKKFIFKKWTSFFRKTIFKHKIISMCILVVLISFGMNLVLISKFIKIIENI